MHAQLIYKTCAYVWAWSCGRYYYSNTFKDNFAIHLIASCRKFAIIRISQSKPDLQYVIYKLLVSFNVYGFSTTIMVYNYSIIEFSD